MMMTAIHIFQKRCRRERVFKFHGPFASAAPQSTKSGAQTKCKAFVAFESFNTKELAQVQHRAKVTLRFESDLPKRRASLGAAAESRATSRSSRSA